MANRYWVGGAGTWNTINTANWSATSGGGGGASAPTSADAVFLDAASGAVSVSGSGALCASLTTTGFTGTLSGTVSIYGSMTLNAGITISAFTPNFQGTGTLTSSGKTLSQISINTGSAVTMADALTLSDRLNMFGGDFNTNGFALNFPTYTSVYALLSNNGGTLTLGASTVSFQSGNGADFSSLTTLNAGTSTLNFSGSRPSQEVIRVKTTSLTFYNVTMSTTFSALYTGLFASSGGTGAVTVNNLTLNPTQGGYYIYLASLTCNGTLTITGSAQNARVWFTSLGQITTVSAAAKSLTNASFQGITAAGAAAPFSGTSIEDLGSNSNITFTTPVTRTASASGAWSTLATWGGSSMPLGQDSVVVNSGVTITGGRTDGAGTYCSGLTVNGDLGSAGASIFNAAPTIGATATLSSSNISIVTSGSTNRTYNINLNGKTVIGLYFSGLLNSTGIPTINLASNVTCSSTFSVYSTVAGSSVTVGAFNISASTISIAAATANLGSGTLTISGATPQISLTSSTTVNWQTANLVVDSTTSASLALKGTANKITLSGASSGVTTTFANAFTAAELLSTKTVPHTIKFTSGTTNTLGAWTVSGSAGNLVTVQATSTTPATLAYSGGGKVSANYLNLSYITGTPTLTWYVGAGSVDGGNNSGLYFVTLSSGASGLFFGSNF